jgi:CubicO group peptidase (beta-lactamase class C family)
MAPITVTSVGGRSGDILAGRGGVRGCHRRASNIKTTAPRAQEQHMKRRIFLPATIGLVLLSVLSPGCAPGDSGGGNAAGDAETLEARIARVEQGLSPAIRVKEGPTWSLEERMARHKVPGLSIAVIEEFEIAWAKGYGVRDASGADPVTPETLFQAASISKPVAAAAALRLVQDGVLDLDENVNRRLSSWKVPENEFTVEEKVTLRRLLSHDAGLTVHGFRGYAPGEPVPDILQVLDGVEPANSDPIRVDKLPGSGFRYSGGGYTVLQLLLEESTGRPLPDLVEDMILRPTDMTHSSFHKPLPPELEALTTAAHDHAGAPFAGHQFLEGGSTCCGLWTTPSDLARFALAVVAAARGDEEALLDPELARAMITPQVDDRMGLGFAIERRGETLYFSHGGGNPGFRCYLILQPDEGYGAVVMTNGTGGGTLAREVLFSIAREYGWSGFLAPEFESLEDAVSELRRMREERPDDPEVGEEQLNSLGYRLLGDEMTDWAVAIFRLNAEFYPDSSNVHDSLGDGLAEAGDTEGALASYRRALALLEARPEKSERDLELIEMERGKIAELAGEAGE